MKKTKKKTSKKVRICRACFQDSDIKRNKVEIQKTYRPGDGPRYANEDL